jgi:hypothetical protein
MGQLQQMAASNPQAAQFLNAIQGKSPQEIDAYARKLYANTGREAEFNQLEQQYNQLMTGQMPAPQPAPFAQPYPQTPQQPYRSSYRSKYR